METQEELFPLEVNPATEVTQKIFGLPALYPWQQLVIANILECGQRVENPQTLTSPEENDILNKGKQVVLLPTGAGKSLCFMVPALLLKGITLIIYPLLALMADQVRRLEKVGIDVVIFKGQQTETERQLAFEKLREGTKITLANPEVLESKSLLKKLSDFPIIHLAIDEAHCVSEWGDSFRPSYLQLGTIIDALKIPIVTAFTATASEPVLKRITEVVFKNESPYLMKSTPDRQNIHYSVVYTEIKEKTALKLALTAQRPMIIFCGTRAKSETTARFFREFFPADEVKFYHAGLTKEEKTATENWFFPHKTGILCCTCAFGMGIDKSDIRTVIHLEVSPSPEAYVQEAGRGGRDGKETKAILLWSKEDAQKFQSPQRTEREKILSYFAKGNSCRRQVLIKALGGEEVFCSGCDVCDAQALNLKIDTFSKDLKFTLDILKKNKGRWTITQWGNELKNIANKKSLFQIYETRDFINLLTNLEKEQIIFLKGIKTKRVYINKKQYKNPIKIFARR